MSDRRQRDDALLTLGRLFVACAEDQMRLVGRAERAEAEADLLAERLRLALGYIQTCVEGGDAEAQALVWRIFPVDTSPQSVEAGMVHVPGDRVIVVGFPLGAGIEWTLRLDTDRPTFAADVRVVT